MCLFIEFDPPKCLAELQKKILCRCTIEFLFVRDTFGVEWLGKSSRIAAVLDLAKREHNRAKSGIAVNTAIFTLSSNCINE